MTDPNLINLAPVKTAIDSLTKHGVDFEIYDKVRVEPTEQSLQDSIEFAKRGKFDAFIAVRTWKMFHLLTRDKHNDNIIKKYKEESKLFTNRKKPKC